MCRGRYFKTCTIYLLRWVRGYFADPDGHIWEIAYADFWQFHDDGSLVLE